MVAIAPQPNPSGTSRTSTTVSSAGATHGSTHDALGAQPTAAEQQRVSDLQAQFQQQAQKDPAGFRLALREAFGDKASPAQIDQLLDLALAGKLPMPSTIQFVDAGSLGSDAFGAYDSNNGGSLYLDSSLLSDPAKLQSVFNEEMGHHLDALLGGADAAGDEGAVFSRTLEQGKLSQRELTALNSENDHGVIQIEGRWIEVEFNDDSGDDSGSSGGECGAGGSESGGSSGASNGSESGSGDAGESQSGAGNNNTSAECSVDTKPDSPSAPAGHQNGNSDSDKAGAQAPATARSTAPAYSGPGSSPGTGSAPASPHGYDEVGIDVPAPSSTPDSSPDTSEESEQPATTETNTSHGYDEITIDVPVAPPEIPRDDEEDDEVAAEDNEEVPEAVVSAGTTVIPATPINPGPVAAFVQTLYNGAVNLLSNAKPAVLGAFGAGATLMTHSRPTGGVFDFDWEGTGTTVHVDGAMGQSTIVVDGVDTGIQVSFDQSPEGEISNVRPATDDDADRFTQLTGISLPPAQPTSDSGPYEPEPVDSQAIDFQPLNQETPGDDLTPEELALAFDYEPTPYVPQIDDSPVESQPEDLTAINVVTADPVEPTAAQQPVVSGEPMPTVQPDDVPGVPPLTPPVIDENPLSNPQAAPGSLGTTVLEGGSNDDLPDGTPGLVPAAIDNSPLTTPINGSTLDDAMVSREATQEEIESTIGGLLETYPQYDEQALRDLAAEGSQGGIITDTSLEELEVAVGAHAAGIVTGDLQPSEHAGHDFETVDRDGNVIAWDVKSPSSEWGIDINEFLRSAYLNDVAAGEQLVINTQNMNEDDIQALKQALTNDSRFAGKYVFYPE